MLLDRLLKPKWQHTDPKVRRQGVEKLDPADSASLEIIHRLASGDDQAEVRRAAVKRANDLMLIAQLAEQDVDANVREVAAARHRQLLAGGAERLPVELRMQAVRESEDGVLLAYVARNGREPELREAAIERLGDASVLSEVALHDELPKLRQLAAGRISDEPTLERLIHSGRERDKRMVKAARQQLAVLRTQREEREALAEAASELCAEAEALRDSAWSDTYHAEIARLENRWHRLGVAVDHPVQQRFHAAITQCKDRQPPAEPKPQEQPAPQPVPRQADAEDLLARLRHEADVHPEWLSELHRMAESADIEPAKRELAEHYLAAASRFIDYREEIEGLPARLESDDAEAPRRVRELLKRIDWPDGFAVPPPLQALRTWQAERRQASAEHEEAQKAVLAQFDDAVPALEQALDAGELRQAEKAHKKLRQLLDQLDEYAARKPAKRMKGLNKRLGELRDWRRFVTLPKQEALCEQMEVLIDTDMSPPDKAQAIKALQNEWKATGGSRTPEAQALWERFREAADKAFEPCREYFAQEGQRREDNLRVRAEICEQLEGFLAQANLDEIDLDGLLAIREKARDEWQAASPVDRREGKALQERFDALIEPVSKTIGDRYEQNRQAKQAVVDEARGLLELDDVRRATDQAKALQAQWRELPPASPGNDRKLWKVFRAICDELFEKRDAVRDESRAQREANLEKAEALCGEVEQFAQQPLNDLNAAARQLREWQQQWRDTHPLPREQERALEQRFRDAGNTVKQAMRQAEQADQLARWQALREQAANHADVTAQAADERLRDLCIRGEIIAGLSSPESEQGRRAELQVARLSAGLAGGESRGKDEEIDLLLADWFGAGLLSEAQRQAYQARFDKAVDALIESWKA